MSKVRPQYEIVPGFASFVVEDYSLEWECFMKARHPVTKDTFTEDLFFKYSDKLWWFFPLTCDFLTNLGKKLGYPPREVGYEVYCFFSICISGT